MRLIMKIKLLFFLMIMISNSSASIIDENFNTQTVGTFTLDSGTGIFPLTTKSYSLNYVVGDGDLHIFKNNFNKDNLMIIFNNRRID